MRRFLLIAIVVIGFSLPFVSAGSPPDDAGTSLADADGSPVVTLGDPAPAAAATTVTTTPGRPIPIPNSADDQEPGAPGREFWTFHGRGLPEDFVERASQIDGVSLVFPYTAGTMHLIESRTAAGTIVDQATPGWAIPLDGAIIDLEYIDDYLGADHGLTAQHVVLGERAARLRGLDTGDTMSFESGSTLTVGAVVPDHVFGESEIIGLALDAFSPDRFQTRAALIRYDGTEPDLDEALHGVYEQDGFGLHERHAFPDHGPRVVRSWVFMKERFGEFEYRPARGGAVEIEPTWIEENIVEVDLPLLGRTKCHRVFAETLAAVMNRLEAEGHGRVIDRSRFHGCWNPRYIRGTTRLSRHAFGIAADINFTSRSGERRGSPTHPALLDAMAFYGVHSGHVWTLPDPGHFEYYGHPDGIAIEEPT